MKTEMKNETQTRHQDTNSVPSNTVAKMKISKPKEPANADKKKNPCLKVSTKKSAPAKQNGFDFNAWEKRLNACVQHEDRFDLWAEGVAFSESAFANYQDALLAVLQNIYEYYYESRKYPETGLQKQAQRSADAILPQAAGNKSNDLANKLVKVAWLKHEQNSDSAQRRALQKRMSTYASAMKNAYKSGEVEKGVTDDNGSILPAKFAEVVKAAGGVSVFSRKSRDELKKTAELQTVLANAGCESLNELNANATKKCIVEGVFNDDTVIGADTLGVSIDLANYSLPQEIDDLVDLPDGEIGVVLVANTGGKNLVRSFIRGADDDAVVNSALLYEHRRLRAALQEAVETEKNKRIPNSGIGKKRKTYVNGVQFTDKELKKLDMLAMKGVKMGLGDDLNRLRQAMLDSVCDDKVRQK